MRRSEANRIIREADAFLFAGPGSRFSQIGEDEAPPRLLASDHERRLA